jgi:hypothetical protein
MKTSNAIWLILLGINMLVPRVYAQQRYPAIISTKIVRLKYQSQTDTLRLPVVSNKYPALKKAMSYRNQFDGDDLDTVVANYKNCGCGITGSDYEVTYQDAGIISIELFFETMGAYPDSYRRWHTLDIHTGKAYPIEKELNPAGLFWLYKKYKHILKQRIIADKSAVPEEDKYTFNDLKTSVDTLRRRTLFSMYVFTAKGIVFSTPPILPHAIRSQEPNRDWFVPYSKLKKFKAAKAKVIK